ncbi:50S ribosomal protein L4 [Mycoplasmopsis hyopharyngis]|uniref:50S ribosomal protein L4 n=1 Tax=Mycoplasmopsis hyopharyngis TaxID=29558 RepID=UPI0038734CE2
MAEEVKKEKTTPKKKTVTKVIGPTEKEKEAAKKAKKVKEAVNELIDALTSSSSIEVEQAEKAKKIVEKITKKKTTTPKETKEKEEKPKKATTPKTTTAKKATAKAKETAVEKEKPTETAKPKKATTTKASIAKKVEEKPAVEKVQKPVAAPKAPTAKKEPKKVAKKEVKKVSLNFDNSKLAKEIFFAEKVSEQAIFDTIVADRAALRQGTHDVKNRAEVSGSGKKPWKQKGTGRARAGSLRSPVFVGGGRAFGPTPERNYKLKVNRKVRKLALRSALTMLASEKAIAVNDLKLEGISTKEILKKLTTLKVNELKTVLIVTNDEIVYRSARNLPNVAIYRPSSVSVEALIGADVLVISKEGLEIVERRAK